MRKFFLLSHHGYPTRKGAQIQGVEPAYDSGYDLEGFDDTRLCKCREVAENFLRGVPLRVTPGKPCDYVPNVLAWPIVSPRLLAVFQKFGTEMQILRADFVDSSGNPALVDYKVLNLLRCLEGTVDLNKSTTSHMTILGTKILNVIDFVFRRDAIPSDLHVFRVEESKSNIIVSADFARAVKEAKMEEIALGRTRTLC
jgi:hypothetical protein